MLSWQKMVKIDMSSAAVSVDIWVERKRVP